jgi:agmatine deiminase
MPDLPQTPTGLGFRMPAEWARQEAVWLSWPHNRATWPGNFRPIPGVFAQVAAQVSLRQKVRINIAPSHRKRALSLIGAAGAAKENVEFYNHPTNDAWCRDHGPIFVRRDRTGEVAVTDWKYNAWGGKYPPYDLDNRIPSRVARALKMRRFANKMVLEGGSIDVNGRGVLLTTEACLLNRNRNPRLSRERIERNLCDFLGVRRVLWLGDGIAGDDTDGHVDDLARFFSENGIVTCVEKNRRDANFRALSENLGRLQAFQTPSGGRYRI